MTKTNNEVADVVETKKPATRKSVSLKAGGSRLTILAQRKKDGTAVTTVTTTDAKKKAARGMTQRFETFELAVSTLRQARTGRRAEGVEEERAKRGVQSASRCVHHDAGGTEGGEMNAKRTHVTVCLNCERISHGTKLTPHVCRTCGEALVTMSRSDNVKRSAKRRLRYPI